MGSTPGKGIYVYCNHSTRRGAAKIAMDLYVWTYLCLGGMLLKGIFTTENRHTTGRASTVPFKKRLPVFWGVTRFGQM